MKLPIPMIKTVKTLSHRFPLYHLLPQGDRKEILKDLYYNYHNKYEKLLYEFKQKGYEKISCKNLKTIIPFLEKAGHHEELNNCLDVALQYYPENSFFYMYFARYFHFQNNIDEALKMAKKAFTFDPANTQNIALMVTLKYKRDNREEADKYALKLLEKFPLNLKILWSVCNQCVTEKQFNKIHKIWQGALNKRSNQNKLYVKTVPAIVTAAARANLFKEGIQLSFEASLKIVKKEVLITKKPKNLRNKYTMNAIRDICEVFYNCGVPFFFAAGTALGFIREGKVLEHDADIDVGIMENDWAPDKIMEAFKKHPHFVFEMPHPDSPKIGLVHCGGADIDIFKFYRETDSLFHNGGFIRWKNSIFNIKKYCFSGTEIYLPDPADKYLTENYGNWRLPDPEFDAFLYAPNTEVTWPEYLELIVARSLYKSLIYNKMKKTRKIANDYKEFLTRTPTGQELLQQFLK
ncbi:MAG: hypothetical protein PF637_11720 [Spirochaetes bacterium]|jgi:tetratricopeptide (TPR) repeat protein|nr:hypothetical protein [Spirochaetota bacterium]